MRWERAIIRRVGTSLLRAGARAVRFVDELEERDRVLGEAERDALGQLVDAEPGHAFVSLGEEARAMVADGAAPAVPTVPRGTVERPLAGSAASRMRRVTT